jgi:hypothetical protein
VHLLVVTNASDSATELDWDALAPLRNNAKTGTSILGATGSGPFLLTWGEPLSLAPWHFQVYRLEE